MYQKKACACILLRILLFLDSSYFSTANSTNVKIDIGGIGNLGCCGASDSGSSEQAIEKDSFNESGNDFSVRDPQLMRNVESSLMLDSGLEFLRWGTAEQIELNRNYYQVYVNELENGEDLGDIVQRFIRELKGYPVYTLTSETLVTGRNTDSKPAWCFHHYMLMDLAKVELKIYKLLANAYATQRGNERFKCVDSYLTDFETSSLRVIQSHNDKLLSQKDPFFYMATHPIIIYRMTRRFAEDLQQILSLLETTEDVDLIDKLYELANPDMLVFPTASDMDSAMDNLNRIQESNVLNTFQLGRGIFEDVRTNISMTTLDALRMSMYYYDKYAMDLAIEWLHLAMVLGKESVAIQLYPEVQQFMGKLQKMLVTQHNRIWRKKVHQAGEKKFTVFNTTIKLPFNPSLYSRHVYQMQEKAYKQRRSTIKGPLMYYNFHRLCSGDNYQTRREKAALQCWYEKSSNKYWYINPLKTEMLNAEPPVLMTYDMIGNDLIDKVQQLCEYSLRRTVASGMGKTIHDLDAIRTSSMTWLDETITDVFTPLSTKLELMTGLKIFSKLSTDAYGVSTYGAAQHYSLHVDAFPLTQMMKPEGNRMVTILGYFNDDIVGGRTAFPVLGLSVKPVKGAVVTWTSMSRSGKYLDDRTYHGACPVILGVKWAVNKWVHYNDNSETLGCTLDEYE